LNLGYSEAVCFFNRDRIVVAVAVLTSFKQCGAGNRMSVYSTSKNVTILPVPVPQNTSGSWTYQGCLKQVPLFSVTPPVILT
jgi:hypothetical protein